MFLKLKNKKVYTRSGFQALIVDTNLFRAIGFYRSPNQRAKGIRDTIKFFEENADIDTIIMGDLNLKEIDWDTGNYKTKVDIRSELAKALISNFRKQNVDLSTRKNNLLDVVISHNEQQITCKPEENSPDCDHIWLQVNLEIANPVQEIPKNITKTIVDKCYN